MRQLGGWHLSAAVAGPAGTGRPDVHLERAGQRVRLEHTGDLLEMLLSDLDGIEAALGPLDRAGRVRR
ncbi:hypothetical protein C3486_08775 [Streptomyces sp. Ru73]|uniref:hypothetical protein n=1 Tax=Streptomyces sp. Ru73 TaxID=2080748 RepID=UPI000CDD7D85|nr:hypothetical protein [Streptomyces sp. Ru73]POX41539.1 hypothetical protein C3486_08775 [Streptomyces sp. Ru73]